MFIVVFCSQKQSLGAEAFAALYGKEKIAAGDDKAAIDAINGVAKGLILPLARVKKIMQLDTDVKQIAKQATIITGHMTVKSI